MTEKAVLCGRAGHHAWVARYRTGVRAVFDALEQLGIAHFVTGSVAATGSQHRDCAQLLHINADMVDRAYLERWAARLDVADRLRELG